MFVLSERHTYACTESTNMYNKYWNNTSWSRKKLIFYLHHHPTYHKPFYSHLEDAWSGPFQFSYMNENVVQILFHTNSIEKLLYTCTSCSLTLCEVSACADVALAPREVRMPPALPSLARLLADVNLDSLLLGESEIRVLRTVSSESFIVYQPIVEGVYIHVHHPL